MERAVSAPKSGQPALCVCKRCLDGFIVPVGVAVPHDPKTCNPSHARLLRAADLDEAVQWLLDMSSCVPQ